MMNKMLSIIIPTLNEEDYLPRLLESIKKQDFNNYEIIVADAKSKDNTVKIANQYNCLVVSGGLPAKGRNQGARSAKGDLFLFLDADTILPKGFLKKSINEFQKRNLGNASFFLIPKGRIAQLFLNIFYNIPIFFMEKFLAHGAMGILIKKEIFQKLNGFDEDIKICEDQDLVRRAKKLGKFGLIRSSKLFISIRRFQKDGWLITYFKYILCELYMIFLGPVKTDIFHYRFGGYSQRKKNKL